MSQKLIAYFSASGSTANLAKTLAAAADAELYEIRPAIPYERRDLNWMDKKSRSTLEMQDKSCRPALADVDAPLADADVIFLGFPIWWYREPSIVDSFLDAYDFSGKTIVPFFTSGGSDLGEGTGADRSTGEKRKGAERKTLFRPRLRAGTDRMDCRSAVGVTEN